MTKYESSTSEYASLYGVTRSTVRRWKSKGAPLDDPEAMRAFRANEKSRTSVSKSNHRRTATRTTPRTRLMSSCAPSSTSCAPNQPKSPKKTKVNRQHAEAGNHVGMRPNIKRLQEIELRRFNACLAAEASGYIAVIKAFQEPWLNAFEQLRRAEVANLEVEKSNKESVSVAEVKIEVHRAYSAVRSALDALSDRLAHKVVGLDISAVGTIVQREVAVICRHLVEWRT